MIALRLTRHPQRLEAEQPIIIEDLLQLVADGQQESVNAMIEMLADLHQSDFASRFVKKMTGLPLWELKTRARGGQKGGARIYFFAKDDLAWIVNCEIKVGDEPSQVKIATALQVALAAKRGIEA
jgi:hypothetical protein